MTRMHRGLPADCRDYLEIPAALLLDDRMDAETKAVAMLMLQASKHDLPFHGRKIEGDFSGGDEYVPVPCGFLHSGVPLEEITEVVLDAYNKHMGPAAKVRALFGTTSEHR